MAPNKLPLVSWLPPSEGATTLEVRDIGHLGILAGMWDEFGFTDALNQAIGVDEQMAVPPGVMLKGLVLNVFSGRDPLYRLRHFFSERVPVDVLLGPGVDADHFNDTSIGRHLDRLHAAGGARAFDAIAMCAIVHEHLEVNRLLRVDTTSRLVFGEFDHPERPDVISVTRGHSKDHRPDLKQVIFGMVTDDDGVPVLGRALDGNTEDKAWFGKVLREIRPRLRVARNQQLHLVGDAALINKPNLDVAAVEGITLTGRLPRTPRPAMTSWRRRWRIQMLGWTLEP